ncbi:TonB-dependent receptor domain-containing protein [Novosphingobium panipatense]|uniref:TonB-dependent receptor domain-containing protein n=1 Tax=Novosphingobium panipatense TaxID=428991 RepID=UPI00360C6DB1
MAPGESEETERNRRGEIVVTARSLSSPDMPTATPVQVLSGDELAHRRQGGLGETLAGLPGVHLDNFGGGASRPVIRGQTVPRIEILSDGANLFDVSSVSPDHAITTDPLLLDGIEVLRGPAAARYGGNAMNGAINLIDSKVPKTLPEGGFSGATEVRFGTGDEEKTLVGRVTAGVGPFAVHAEGSRRRSENYNVSKAFGSGELRDSFADSSSYSFGASWITSKGYIGAAYTRQDSEYGLPGHSHINGVCHTHGTDLHCAAHDEFDDPFGSSDNHTAYIKLRSERVDVRGDYDDLLPGLAHARVRLSYTDYKHDEIDGPALFSQYSNKVYDARVELTHAPLLGFTGTLGAQYTHGTFNGINKNDVHKGLPTSTAGFLQIPPDYVTESIGVFLSERRSFGAIDVEIAARKDWRDTDIPFTPWVISSPLLQSVIDAFEARNGAGSFRRRAEEGYRTVNPLSKHNPFSASLAMTWRIGDGYSAALSLARTQRAPNVRELYAYGNNLATNSYEVGLSQTRRASSQFPLSTTDVMETAKAVNLTLRKTVGHSNSRLGCFIRISRTISLRAISKPRSRRAFHTII